MRQKIRRPLRTIGRLLCCLALLGAASAAHGGDEPTAPATLSEDDAVRLALANNCELAVLAGEIRERELLADFAAGDINNPELRVQDLSSTYFSEEENRQLQVGLRWQPPALGELGLEAQEETVALSERTVQFRNRRVELAAEVRLTFAETIMRKAALEIAVRQSDLEGKRLEVIENLVSLGERRLLEQIKARKRLRTTQSEAAKIRQLYLNNRTKLTALTGSEAAPADLPDNPPLLELDLDCLRETARKHRPESALTAQQAELAVRRRRVERGKLAPWISFVEVDQHFESDDEDWQELRLGLQLPLFNWNSGKRQAAALAVAQTDQDAAAVAEAIDGELAAAVADYRLAVAEWRSMQSEKAEFLPRINHLIEAAHRQGTLPADEVIDLELAALEIQMVLLESGHEVTKAAIALCAAVGVEHWDELGD